MPEETDGTTAKKRDAEAALARRLFVRVMLDGRIIDEGGSANVIGYTVGMSEPLEIMRAALAEIDQNGDGASAEIAEDALRAIGQLDRVREERAAAGRREEQALKEHNDMRLALAAFIAAYGNCDVDGAIMPLAHKPERPPGLTDNDAMHVALFTAWLRAVRALGISLPKGATPQKVTGY